MATVLVGKARVGKQVLLRVCALIKAVTTDLIKSKSFCYVGFMIQSDFSNTDGLSG